MAAKATEKKPQKQKQQDPVRAGNEAAGLATNLFLREVARKLSVIEPNKSISRSVAFDRLWKLLRAGQLTAGFFIEDLWIEIPDDFWKSLDSDRLKDLLKQRKGKLQLHLAELSDVIVDFVTRTGGTLGTSGLRALLGRSKKGFEPEISEQSWSSFLDRNKLVDRPAHQKTSSKGGLSQSDRWRDVSEFILAYCIVRPVAEYKKERLQNDMRVALEKLGLNTSGWPGDSSLRDVIKRGTNLAIQLKQVYPK